MPTTFAKWVIKLHEQLNPEPGLDNTLDLSFVGPYLDGDTSKWTEAWANRLSELVPMTMKDGNTYFVLNIQDEDTTQIINYYSIYPFGSSTIGEVLYNPEVSSVTKI